MSEAERTIAVIGNLTRASGFMGVKQKAYTLMITDRRLLFAELTKERMNAVLAQAKEEAKAQGKGFFGQWGAQLGGSMNQHQAYWQMSPEEALAEAPGNFEVDRGAIKEVKFKTGISDDEHNSPDMVIIKTTGDTYKLQVGGALSAVKGAFKEAGIL